MKRMMTMTTPEWMLTRIAEPAAQAVRRRRRREEALRRKRKLS